MKLKQCMYKLLVNEYADIGVKYRKYRDEQRGMGKSKAWLYLLKLNIQYRTNAKKTSTYNRTIKKSQIDELIDTSESALSSRVSPKDFAKQLVMYDVISFDIFDTLIFRPFAKPSDLFFFIGNKLNYLNFKEIRMEIEEIARRKAYEQRQSREVAFEEIWNVMEEEVGIDKTVGMNTEWEEELQFCFANPYMLQVIKELQILGKKIILISDMYFGKEYIQQLLTTCGYQGLDECFVSCDYGYSKSEGRLYDIVKKKFESSNTFVHIGDNFYSDKKQAEKHGFASIYYKNVNDVGMKYRPKDMSSITGSIYSGLINSYIHNGLKIYSKEYEFGFIYGGLFILGYCQWIHKYVQEHSIDKILFLARDGDILSKVYAYLYPQESENLEYVYWSRLVAAKLSARYYKYDFFQRFLYQKINQKYTLHNIFQTMELQDMLETFLTSTWNKKNHTEHSVLNDILADEVKGYLVLHWEEVLAHYVEESSAGHAYYKEVLKGCTNVVAVDVGWAGSGAVALHYIVNHIWEMNCNIVGLIGATNSKHSKNQDASESLLYTGQLESYSFSQEHNRNIWNTHNPGKGDNLILESLLTAKHGSLKRLASNNKEHVFANDKSNKYVLTGKQSTGYVEEIQQGILDFTKYYLKHMKGNPTISAHDAFAPIALLAQSKDVMKQFPFINTLKMNVE